MSKSTSGPELYNSDKEIYWHIESCEDTLKELKSSKSGLSTNIAQDRLKVYGKNAIQTKSSVNPFLLFFSKFNSLLIYVLLATSLISLYLGHTLEFYIVLAIIGFTVVLSFIQEYRAEKSVEALSELTASTVECIRDGKAVTINAEDLVPGDIVKLSRGLIVPADLRIFESSELKINESILTGESLPKGKIVDALDSSDVALSDKDNLAFGGTSVMSGAGKGVVIHTGLSTEIGKISTKLKTATAQKSPLQLRVDGMSKRVSYAVILLAAFTYFFLIGRGEPVGSALLLVSALAVAGIPEGFPLALTMALSSGVRRMAGENAVVKDMGSVETLGTTTVICTDKTGTLTENKMMVVRANIGGNEFNIHGSPYESTGVFSFNGKEINISSLEKYRSFFEVCVLNNNSQITHEEGKFILHGEPTEGALLSLASSAGLKTEILKKEKLRVHEIPFDSTKKYMVTIHKDGKAHLVSIKGAVEKVLNKCSHIQWKGKKVKLTLAYKKKVLELTDGYTQSSLRVLGVASKLSTKKSLSKSSFEKLSKEGFVFQGLVGIQDPLRESARLAVQSTKKAGVKTVMVTGDHKDTATSIGKQLGIVHSDNDVMTGADLDTLSEKELDERIENISVFARTTPDHKFRIVQSFQRRGEIVAMTGDGVNDAPALKEANIGVSMGKEGTDVARESSNMVLMDDAFDTIVKAVREGRTIYSNIRKFTYYLLTINVAEVFLILFAIFFGLINPLTAIMILFINVITSTIPSLGISVEPTDERVMEYEPRSPKERLLSNYLLLKIFVIVPLLTFGTLGAFLYELYYGGGDIEKARTLAFTTIIVFELFHAFNARSLHTTVFSKRFFTNKVFFASIFIAIGLLFFSLYTSVGNILLGTVPISALELLTIVAIGSTALIITEVSKLLIKAEIEEQSKLQGVSLDFE